MFDLKMLIDAMRYRAGKPFRFWGRVGVLPLILLLLTLCASTRGSFTKQLRRVLIDCPTALVSAALRRNTKSDVVRTFALTADSLASYPTVVLNGFGERKNLPVYIDTIHLQEDQIPELTDSIERALNPSSNSVNSPGFVCIDLTDKRIPEIATELEEHFGVGTSRSSAKNRMTAAVRSYVEREGMTVDQPLLILFKNGSGGLHYQISHWARGVYNSGQVEPDRNRFVHSIRFIVIGNGILDTSNAPDSTPINIGTLLYPGFNEQSP